VIRLGVVGLGWWGRQIVRCLASSPRLRVVAGCDLDPAAAAPFAREHGLDLVDTYDALLARRDLDAVAIVTPHAQHEAQVLAAVAAGKQVFCEKPLALSAASAERMLDACASAGLVLGIGHERRYEPALEELRQLAEAGALGRLLMLDANFSHNLFRAIDPANWRLSRADAPAAAMTALGIHLTDMFVSLAGAPVRVAARTATLMFTPPAEDFVAAEIDFANGTRARITCLSSVPFYGRFTAIGDQGWVEVQEAGNVDKGLPSTLVHADGAGARTTRTFEWTDTVRKNFEAWADAIEGRKPYRFAARELLANIRVLDAIVRSADQGGAPVKIALTPAPA
jgi:predicted dehydrogenase